MSTLIVEVCEVLEVNPHPNADRLEILRVKGWNVVAQKGLVRQGDPIVYFPPDSVLTDELADKLGIRNYLAKTGGGYRVKAAILRGEPSFGTIDHAVPAGYSIGDDVTSLYGVTKYEPPIKDVPGESLPDHPRFHKFTDIENIRNYPDILLDGEEVIVTEKLHGSLFRGGLVDGQWMAGSHKIRRREEGMYWKPLEDPSLKNMIAMSAMNDNDVIAFCEIIGSGVQDMAYGYKNGEKGYRLFALSINRRYVDPSQLFDVAARFDVPTVPILYHGSFSWDVVAQYTDGPTTLCPLDQAGKFTGREGIVITPCVERTDPSLGRVILKSISADYLARKGGTDSH